MKKRREIYLVDFGECDEEGTSVQKGIRPALLIQNNLGNKFSPTFSFIPFTSKHKKLKQLTHVKTKYNGVALCEQIVTVDSSKIKEYIGILSKEEMKKIDNALMIQLGLKPIVKQTK